MRVAGDGGWGWWMGMHGWLRMHGGWEWSLAGDVAGDGGPKLTVTPASTMARWNNRACDMQLINN